MNRFFSGITLSLASLLAHASDEAAAVQLPPSDPTAMILFAVVFFGGIGITAFFMWKNERNRKQLEGESK